MLFFVFVFLFFGGFGAQKQEKFILSESGGWQSDVEVLAGCSPSKVLRKDLSRPACCLPVVAGSPGHLACRPIAAGCLLSVSVSPGYSFSGKKEGKEWAVAYAVNYVKTCTCVCYRDSIWGSMPQKLVSGRFRERNWMAGGRGRGKPYCLTLYFDLYRFYNCIEIDFTCHKVPSFKIHSSVIFHIFTELCSHHQNKMLDRAFAALQEETTCTSVIFLRSQLPCPQPQVTTVHFLSPRICQFCTFHTNGIGQRVLFVTGFFPWACVQGSPML